MVECDITKDEALDDLFQQAEKTFSKIDCVINSAGVMDVFDPAGDLDPKMWDRVISINLTAPVMITKRAVNHMLKNDIKGSIVNIASIAAFRGFSSGNQVLASSSRAPSLTTRGRLRVYSLEARGPRPDKEHCCVLWAQGHPLQCRPGRWHGD